MSPNCSMISSEKKIQTSTSSTSQQNLQVKKSSPTANLHFSSIFSGLEEAEGTGNPIPFFHLSPARGQGPTPPCGSPEAKASGSRFTSIASSIRQGLRTVSTTEGGREVRDGFSPGKFFFGLGFGYFQVSSEVTK